MIIQMVDVHLGIEAIYTLTQSRCVGFFYLSQVPLQQLWYDNLTQKLAHPVGIIRSDRTDLMLESLGIRFLWTGSLCLISRGQADLAGRDGVQHEVVTQMSAH